MRDLLSCLLSLLWLVVSLVLIVFAFLFGVQLFFELETWWLSRGW